MPWLCCSPLLLLFSRYGASSAFSNAAIADRLEVEANRVAAVRLAGSSNAWVARVFISATDAPAMRRLLPKSEQTSDMASLLERVRPVRQLLAVNPVVKAAALPPASARAQMPARACSAM